MATGECDQNKSSIDQIETGEVTELVGWISPVMEEGGENKSESLENINKPDCFEVESMEEDVVRRSTKRIREDDELGWTTVENRGKKLKQIKREVFILSKEKLPKQFAIAKLFTSLGMSNINQIKYINPYKLKIEVSNEECVGRLLDCQEFQAREWRVYSAMDVNVSYGIIRDVDLELSDEEAKKAIRCLNDVAIISLKRLQRRDEEGRWVPSEVAQVAFSGSYLPSFVYID